MVLIISDERDESTHDVITWLRFYKVPFVRLNQEDSIKNIDIDLSNESVRIETQNGKEVDFDRITSYWYRKGDLKLYLNRVDPEYLPYLESEWSVIVAFIIFKLEQKDGIGSYGKEGENNKFKNLCVAKSVGLNIPSTNINASRNSLLKVVHKNYRTITKSMHHDFSLNNGEMQLRTKGTVLVSERMLAEMDDYFFPSFTQEYIEKEYELRVFFLENRCYTICVFSQMSEATRVDQRNYDFNKMNRMVPFRLPESIHKKICALMQELGLDSGSLDLIVNKKQEYVFLEVNPIGQFAWVSKVGSYKLEKKIAMALKNRHHYQLKQQVC